MDAYWQLPGLARTLTTATVVLSLGVHTGILSISHFIHHPFYLWKIPPQIWRPVTSFFIAGSGLNMLFDSYFLYNYLSQLETGNPRFPRKVDLVWYLMFVGGTILMINYLVDMPFFMFLRALILSMVYTVTQDQRGMKATFYFITIPAQLTPVCMILVNLLFPGGYMTMLLQLEGLVAAHLYEFLTRIWPEFGNGPRLLATPAWLSRIVPTPRVLERGFGTAVRNEPSSGSSTGASRGPLPDSWRTRGPGHRLG
ncbi:hypothetical protein ACJ41O_013516 [Fusarium nematophilum]